MDWHLIALVQRVSKCQVHCDGFPPRKIRKGMSVFLGIEKSDTKKDIKYIVQKLLKLRIFDDEDGKMNLSVSDISGDIMIISQFTLCADTQKGNRPSYINAMRADLAQTLYADFINHLKSFHSSVKTGFFQKHMEVEISNNGPVTLTIRSSS